MLDRAAFCIDKSLHRHAIAAVCTDKSGLLALGRCRSCKYNCVLAMSLLTVGVLVQTALTCPGISSAQASSCALVIKI